MRRRLPALRGRRSGVMTDTPPFIAGFLRPGEVSLAGENYLHSGRVQSE